jgi:hypothetical protein
MFIDFDEVRDFALSFVDKMIEDGQIKGAEHSDDNIEFDIQDSLIEHFLTKFKVEDCLIPEDGEAYEITDINEDYMVAFISSGGIPLGIFVIFIDTFEEEDIEIERLFVSINHNVVYLDGQTEEE